MLIEVNTEFHKSQKEIAEIYGKSEPMICKALKNAKNKGVAILKIELSSDVLFDIRTLPESIKTKKKKNVAPVGS